MSNETLDEAGVEAKFGVRPDQVLDLLTLTGDSVDNIPGVPKVGPKTAAKWLAQYGTLDKVIAEAASIPGVVGENLRQTIDWLPQGKRLLTVRCDCRLDMSYRDLSLQPRDDAKLREMFERFEFKQWIRDLGAGSAIAPQLREPAESSEPASAAPRAEAIATHYETVLDAAQWQRWWNEIRAAELVAFKVYAAQSEPLQAEIVGLAFAVAPGRACYVP